MAKTYKRLYLLINISLIISTASIMLLAAFAYYGENCNLFYCETAEQNTAISKYLAAAAAFISLFFTSGVLTISTFHLKIRLNSLEKKINILTVTDDLTRLFNRTYFLQKLKSEFERASRYNYPLSLIISNIDSLKTINEKYGLNEGDRVLKTVADIIKPLCRESDTVARYGESEFAVILPNTGEKGALVIAEKLRSNVEHYKYKKGEHPVTISLGISSVNPESAYSPETLIYNADTALYRAKESGRNMAVFYSPE